MADDITAAAAAAAAAAVAAVADDVTAATVADVTAATVTDVITATVTDVISTTAADVITTTAADVITTTVADVITTTVADVITTTAAMADITTAAMADITTAAMADITTAGADTHSSAFFDPLTVAKTVAILVLGLGSFALGVVPLALFRRWRSGSLRPRPSHHRPGEMASGSWTVSLLLCFAGGVLLCTTLLHLQPEVREAMAAQQREGHRDESDLLADLLFCLGFFMVLAVDELARTVLGRRYCGSRRRRQRGASEPRDDSPSSAANQPSASVSLISFREAAEPESRDSPLQESQEENESTESQQQQQQQQQQQRDDDDDDDDRHDEDVEEQRIATSDGHSMRGLFAVLALSFHEVFEGLALGLESRVDHMWYLFVAVATHKLVIAFCVGLDLAWSNTRRVVLVAYVAMFAMVTPVGIACGMAIARFGVAGSNGSPGRVAVVLQGLAVGTLLYVVFFEMLTRHRQSSWSHLAAIVVGFGTLYALQMLTYHHHRHYRHGNEHGQVTDFGHGEGNFPYHDHHNIHEQGHNH